MDTSSNPLPDWSSWLEAQAGRYLFFARTQTRSEADAQDLLQEALVEVWRRTAGRAPDDALVFKTLRRRAIDLGRSTDRRERREQAALDWWQAPTGGEADRDRELEHAVETLPAILREVITLKIWGGLTFRQIAETVGLPQDTAASRYRCAIEQLRRVLGEVRT